ncbi:MAG: DUF3160 domain-containing protein [Acidimicrobiia bacterium]|nr:DUF3160 domain-containing protein [Acidimicrobiia bacterium]
MKRWSILLLVFALLAAACTTEDEPASTTGAPTTQAPSSTTTAAPSATTSSPPAPTTTLPPVVVPAGDEESFGELDAVPLLSGGPAYAGPGTPSSLGGVSVADWINDYLDSNDAKGQLTSNGFVIVPGTTRHFHHIYEGAAYDGWPVFVTTDAAYHVWHLAFDKILRETEQQTLLPALEEMVTRLVELARAQENELADTELAEAANRVTQFYEAAATVLELDVGPIGPLAEAEVQLIMAADRRSVSPTTGGDENSGFITTLIDYSLFRPRGHYTRTPELERFFRGMSQLGNNAFLLGEGMQLGILASRVLLADPEVVARWQLIYEPTAWLVGAADDYTPLEVGAVVEQVVPTGWTDTSVFADEATVAKVRDGLAALRSIGINPAAASVRIMGARLVIDSYIFDQLVAPSVQERDEASPLDLAAAFGSQWAYDVQEAAGNTSYAGYDSQLAAMQEIIGSRTAADWGKTVYDAWLWSIQPMWQARGVEYPDFMRTAAWDAKSHQTGFGSYTELKHDTILYTKQAVAEGGGEEPPPLPRNWVEPEPAVFERLAALADLMQTGLESRDLLLEDYSWLLTGLVEFYGWLGGIARDELAGLPISEEDNRELSWIGSTLEDYWITTSDLDIDWENGPDSHAALIADVMSNADGFLELGTGYVDHIFVLVPDNEGDFQVASGGVYSYYEFWKGDGLRLTDEEWRDMLDAATNPPRPGWQDIFLAGEPPTPRNRTGLEAGLFCRDLADMGYGFWMAVPYWLAEGAPDRMDADRNGIPCETVFPEEYESFLNAAIGLPSGQRCADLGLADDVFEYEIAIAYWMLEGAPDRMDADGNGIPCETVFSRETVNQYLSGEF